MDFCVENKLPLSFISKRMYKLKMLILTFGTLFLCQFLVVIVNCDHLIVNTASGKVKGVEQTTFLSSKKYISYKGIPYAKPPIGELRFRV